MSGCLKHRCFRFCGAARSLGLAPQPWGCSQQDLLSYLDHLPQQQPGHWCGNTASKFSGSSCAESARPLTASNPSTESRTRRQQTPREKAALSQLGTGPFQLDRWRLHDKDLKWHWGDNGASLPCEVGCGPPISDQNNIVMPDTLAGCAVQVLLTASPEEKIALTHCHWRRLVEDGLPVGTATPHSEPARPDLPKRVPAKEVPKPKQSGVPLPVYMLLNLAHIELNAIDLAWDTVARFSQLGLPRRIVCESHWFQQLFPGRERLADDVGRFTYDWKEFYVDFAHVAEDESRHLGWCLQRLQELGHRYGDIPAHDMLWQGAQNSADEVVGRLVVVPCSQEARGLDAGPRLVEKLRSAADPRSAAIVHRISTEELAHVAVGSHWFRRICWAMGQEPGASFRSWLAKLSPELTGGLSGHFNHPARSQAGLEQEWYDSNCWPTDTDLPPSGLADLSPLELELLFDRLRHVLDIETASSQD